ncbi:MAG: orotate phosphoribosyltransferase [Firmicutes bacterium]|nr:orotate phosphoribosyltransferase [Bacillota bacterium]
MLTTEAAMQTLVESGAVLTGHFLLTSGRHSNQYVEKFRLLERPDLTERLLSDLARRFRSMNVEVVLGPAVGGIIVAYEMARQLGVRAVFAEREGGRLTLRRGFRLRPGERCLVVEDVVTTGGSVREAVAVAQRAGGDVAGVALLVDRSGGRALNLGVPVEYLVAFEAPSWDPAECPLCRQGVPLEHRGSRDLL